MSTPSPSNDLTQAQYNYYKAVTRLANLWHALTVIALVLYVLVFVGACVGAILGAGSIAALIQSISSQYGN
jgi:hypothetical protein